MVWNPCDEKNFCFWRSFWPEAPFLIERGGCEALSSSHEKKFMKQWRKAHTRFLMASILILFYYFGFLIDSDLNFIGFSCFQPKMCQKVVQKWSCFTRSRGRTEKSQRKSKSSWFETLGIVKLLFLEDVLMTKTLGWSRKKPVTRGPPKSARRAPLRAKWGRVLRTPLSR